MRIILLALIVMMGQSSLAWAGKEPAPKLIHETWDAAYLVGPNQQGGRAGYVRTYVNQYDMNGQKIYAAIAELRLTVKRFSETIQLSMDSGTFETDQGKVVGTLLRQYLGKTRQAEIVGMVKDGYLHLTLDKEKPLQPAPWNDQVVGLYRQQKLFQEQKLKPGDEFVYLSFEPTINLVMKAQVKAKDYEMIELAPGKPKKRLLRVETRPEKIEKVQLPPLVQWLDENYVPLRSRMEIPGLGQVILLRTDKTTALASGPVASLTDIGVSQLVKLSKRINMPHETTEAIFRVTIQEEEDPGTAFSQDARQQVKKVKGNSFELHVRNGKGGGPEAEIGAEFSQSSYFIGSADSKVKEHARRAVGQERDPWMKALRIEKWVHDHMKPTNHEALAPADQVARTLQGDCSEFAMLMAAMCRAEGVPSRTAIGLIYAEVRGIPAFAFHMWTEVGVNGQWIPLDATLGRGYVGATHLKITDHSWHDTRTMTPLFPVLRVVGRLSIEVVQVKH